MSDPSLSQVALVALSIVLTALGACFLSDRCLGSKAPARPNHGPQDPGLWFEDPETCAPGRSPVPTHPGSPVYDCLTPAQAKRRWARFEELP